MSLPLNWTSCGLTWCGHSDDELRLMTMVTRTNGTWELGRISRDECVLY